MSICPICGRIMCDHSPKERQQSPEETYRNLTKEEEEVYQAGNLKKILKIANERIKNGKKIYPCLIVF